MVLLYVMAGALVVFVLTIITAIVRGMRRRDDRTPDSPERPRS